MMLSDKEIIEGIASKSNAVVKSIYKEIYPFVKTYIENHAGSEQQAEDIFQEGLIIVFRKIENEELELHCKFSTYLYAICKNLWIQDRKKYQMRMNKMKEISYVEEPEPYYVNEPENNTRELFEKHFLQLSPDCQKILRLYFNDLSIEEISKVMGIKTIHQTSDKKYRCKRKLIEKIKKDPLYKKIKK